MTRARKRFGQHFLEPAWSHASWPPSTRRPATIVEIGPGRGALTLPLAARAAGCSLSRWTGISRRHYRAALPERHVHIGDVLSDDIDAVSRRGSTPPCRRPRRAPRRRQPAVQRVVADPLPAGSVAAAHPGFTDATIMLQAEVAERFAAPPGTREYGVLTVLTALRADVTRVLELPPGRVPACARGPLGAGAAGFRPRRCRRSAHPTLVAVGPRRVHPAAQDTGKRIEGLGGCRRRRRRRGARRRGRRWRAPAGDAAPR